MDIQTVQLMFMIAKQLPAFRLYLLTQARAIDLQAGQALNAWLETDHAIGDELALQLLDDLNDEWCDAEALWHAEQSRQQREALALQEQYERLERPRKRRRGYDLPVDHVKRRGHGRHAA